MGSEVGPRIIRSLVEVFDSAGINYAFIHGLEAFPARTGRDVDLLVQSDQIAAASACAGRHLRAAGWKFMAHRRVNGHTWCFVAPGDSSVVFEFDLIPQLRWGPVILARKPSPTAGIHGLKVDLWAAFVKRILLQLMGGNLVKLERRPEELSLTQEERRKVVPLLKKYLGVSLAATLLAAIERRDFTQLRSLVSELRKTLLLRSLAQRPDRLVAATFDWFRTEVAASPLGKPILPVIALVGVDGVGKSSVIRELGPEMTARLPVLRVQTRHWRPGVLPNLAYLLKRGPRWEEGQPAPPRRDAGRGGTLRLFYYGADFWLGGWWKDRRAVSQLEAVVYDRCALDMRVDPARFYLDDSKSVRFVTKLLPSPDIVFLLHDTPERIHARKCELDVEEIERQQTEWLTLVAQGKVHHVLSVQDSPKALAREIVDQLISQFCA